MARLVTFDGGHFLASGAGYYATVPPSLALSVVSTTFAEGATITFRVTASKLWDEDITVAYATSNGTATAGVDYTAASGTVTIPAGTTTVDLSVVTIDRDGVQADRDFTMTISSPLTSGGDVPVISTAAQTVTIDDTDVALPVPSLVASVIGPAEEGSPLTFRVATQGNTPTPSSITFQYETQDLTAINGTDYIATAGDGFIPAGGSAQEFTVNTILRPGYLPARQVRFAITAANTTIATSTATGVITDTESGGTHAYWDTLVADSAFVPAMSRSFRDQGQIDLLSGNKPNLEMTYGPASDTYTRAKDAAKIVIAPFQPVYKATAQLVAPMNTTQMTMNLADLNGDVTKVTTSLNARGRQIIVDDEVMILTEAHAPLDRATGILTIGQRGAYGTAITSHDIGARPRTAGSDLRTQARIPLNTEDGYVYQFTWDWCHTRQWLRCNIGGYKMFQFSSNGDQIWLEPQNLFPANSNATTGFNLDTHVGWTGRMRSYCRLNGSATFANNAVQRLGWLGPGPTGNQPLVPYANGGTGEFFLQYPDRWVRQWVRIEQRANDYAIMNAWIADEVQGPFQVYDNVLVEVRGTWNNGTSSWTPPRTINKFWVELDTSNAYIPDEIAYGYAPLGLPPMRDLITYVKNFATLRWPIGSAPSITPYLVKPEFES